MICINKTYQKLFLLAVICACMFITGCKKIDKTYENASFSANKFSGTVLDYLKSRQSGIFDSLLYLVNKVEGFSNLLKSDSITLFAPVNTNFNLFIKNLNLERSFAGNNKQPLSLSTIDAKILDTALNKYLISGLIVTDDLKNYVYGGYFMTAKYSIPVHLQLLRSNASGLLLGGPSLIIISDTHELDLLDNWDRSQTDFVNIKTTNGIIHIIGPGEVFGFGNYLVRSINRKQ